MNTTTYNKPLIIIFLLVLLAGAYFWFVRDTAPTGEPEATPVIQEPVIGHEIIESLSLLKGITLGSDLFRSNTFESLQDFNLRIQNQGIGRTDPFAPLSRSATDIVVTQPANAF